MIVIDSIDYDIPIVSLSGQADMLDKYAERTVDGVLHRELIGVYDNYEIQVCRLLPQFTGLLRPLVQTY